MNPSHEAAAVLDYLKRATEKGVEHGHRDSDCPVCRMMKQLEMSWLSPEIQADLVERAAVGMALSDDSPCTYGFNNCEASPENMTAAERDEVCRCRRLALIALEAIHKGPT